MVSRAKVLTSLASIIVVLLFFCSAFPSFFLTHSYATSSGVFSSSSNVDPKTLSSPNPRVDGSFGWSVSTSGSSVVVGAPSETANGLIKAGHAYIFSATTGKLIETLASPNARTQGLFGWSVAMSSNIVAVGAIYENANGVQTAGRAYTFNAGTGKLIATLTSPNSQVDGSFGWSVAMSGNIVVVGAPGETRDGEVGYAYAFSATTGKLIRTLSSPNPQISGEFGISVAISGNVVIVGDDLETANGHPLAGHAYIFNGLQPVEVIRTLTSPNEKDGGFFGTSVAVSGNIVVVGTLENPAGRAYTFNAGTGKLIATLTSPNALTNANLGISVAISGTTVVVGAPYATAKGYYPAGRSYIFSATTGKIIATLTSPNVQSAGIFGNSVAVSSNIVAVGAPSESANGYVGAGHAYIFFE
jgi:hypothetical protein